MWEHEVKMAGVCVASSKARTLISCLFVYLFVWFVCLFACWCRVSLTSRLVYYCCVLVWYNGIDSAWRSLYTVQYVPDTPEYIVPCTWSVSQTCALQEGVTSGGRFMVAYLVAISSALNFSLHSFLTSIMQAILTAVGTDKKYIYIYNIYMI